MLDYESRFAKAVIDSFAESYVAGETPIPCVTCNQQIKFRDLLETAKELGADVLATGHYIQRREGADGPELARAADAERDQSYFLFATTPEQLALPVVPARRHAQGARCARSRASSSCPSPKRPTARTSASCRRAATPASSSA